MDTVIVTVDKPDCFKCKHKGHLAGTCHIRCLHPRVASFTSDEILTALSMLAQEHPFSSSQAPLMQRLGITGHPHGIRCGWFNWPWEFDPAWLETCAGYEEGEGWADSLSLG